MGASAKTLSRLTSLHQSGLISSGASMIELGAQELYCTGMEDYVRDVIRSFSERDSAIKPAELYTPAELQAIADRALMGKLMTACGFSYCALDIFEAENTIVFDLNVQSPGKDLAARFDLVTNFGTTEHLINQYQAFKTMHELAKPGGLIYHDLPLSGYHEHGYFSYNPLFFRQLALANDYNVILERYSNGGTTRAPAFMLENGYSLPDYFDCGIEFILQKTSAAGFRMPLETSTSLAVSDSLCGDHSPYGNVDFTPAARKPALVLATLSHVSGWDLQRELFRRYRRKAASLLKRN